MKANARGTPLEKLARCSQDRRPHGARHAKTLVAGIVFAASLCAGCATAPSPAEALASVEQRVMDLPHLTCEDLRIVDDRSKGENVKRYLVEANCTQSAEHLAFRQGSLFFTVEYLRMPGGWGDASIEWSLSAPVDQYHSLEEATQELRRVTDRRLLYALGIPTAIVFAVVFARFFLGRRKQGYRQVARRMKIARGKAQPHQTRSFDSVVSIDDGND